MQDSSNFTIPPSLSIKGSVTVYFLFFLLLFFALLVVGADLGRIYLVQGELQTAADAAALAAATQLFGTADGTTRADNQILAAFDSTTGNDNRFNLRMNQIAQGNGLVATTTVDYFSTLVEALGNTNGAANGGIDWSTGLYPKYVRVQISAQAPVIFASLVNRSINTPPTVTVSAVAGVSSPICSACGIEGFAVVDQSAGADNLNYGFVPGTFYTLFLTPTQRGGPQNQAPLAGTSVSVQYVLLNHFPAGPQDLDLDATLFEMGAGGLNTNTTLTIPATVIAGTTEAAYPIARGNTSATTGQDILCGLNARFGVDPSTIAPCSTIGAAEFLALAPLFSADSDIGGLVTYAAGDGLQDFATEYSGSARRVLTVGVVDATDALNVLNFRQFLIEPSPVAGAVIQGLNPALATAAFRAQYLGAPVPLRCGAVGGLCSTNTFGVGKVVLH